MSLPTRNRGPLALLGLLLVAGVGGCNSATSTLGTLPVAALTLTVVPNPVIASPSTEPADFDFDIQWSVTITETAGVGGTFQFITASLFDPTTGAKVAGTSLDPAALQAQYGESHLPPKGTLTVQQHLSYRLASRTAGALLSIEVQMKDDNGSLVGPATLVEVE